MKTYQLHRIQLKINGANCWLAKPYRRGSKKLFISDRKQDAFIYTRKSAALKASNRILTFITIVSETEVFHETKIKYPKNCIMNHLETLNKIGDLQEW